jgi:hypothetical protein
MSGWGIFTVRSVKIGFVSFVGEEREGGAFLWATSLCGNLGAFSGAIGCLFLGWGKGVTGFLWSWSLACYRVSLVCYRVRCYQVR